MPKNPIHHSPFTNHSLRRYVRHLPLIGESGQQRLAEASVLIVGAGGLGCAAMGYLAAMGVGKLTIMDEDRIELSNLNRQTLYEVLDIGARKIDAAKSRLIEIAPDCEVTKCAERLTEKNAGDFVARHDLTLDATDNFPARYALNDACLATKKPWIHAAISGWDGIVTTFKPGGPCYRCYVPETPTRIRDCAQEGMLGALAGVVGSVQAVEAIKEILHIGDSLSGRLMRYDGLRGQWSNTILHRDPACVSCGDA